MTWLGRLLLNRFALLALLWLAAVGALHVGQVRHDRLPLDLAALAPPGETPRPGALLATTLAAIMRHELSGTGWRPNDFFLWGPRVLADNNANRQLGILQAVRRTTQVMKEHLTKISSDSFDPNLEKADNAFRYDERRFFYPTAEGRYALGVRYLEDYVRGLEPELQTSKPLTLRNMELLRLFQAWSDMLGDAHANLYRTEIDGHRVRPWESDDLFYHAQGYTHVMAACLRAIQREYARSFAEREMLASLVAEVASSLEYASRLKPIVVLDGSDSGLAANHRRNLDVYVAEARQKIYSIREELEK
ncbi:MAG: hypothetical protein B6D46_06955 [Polyangiaceae bacterium UTPRO1]|jgi:hypothetical protein|nr:DUF2333 family protein [Myxococcales bacterium]OQY67765.1 MAG: hypothetical protein B6D46_06955 [Polyangiaceae bacterium UTPRO1]